MEIIAHGQLQHHFWGEYRATIVVKFATARLATAALGKFPGFEIHPTEPSALRFFGGGSALRAVEALLKGYGANAKKLTSLAKSIDFGEPFTIAVDLASHASTCEQLGLFAIGG